MAGTSGVTTRPDERAARREYRRRCWSKRTIVSRRCLPLVSQNLVGAKPQWLPVLGLAMAVHASGSPGWEANYEFMASMCPSPRGGEGGVSRSTWGVYRREMVEEGWLNVIAWTEPGARGSSGHKETLIYSAGPRLLEQLDDPAAAGAARRKHEIRVYMRQRGTPPRVVPTQQDLPDPTPANGECDVVWDDEARETRTAKREPLDAQAELDDPEWEAEHQRLVELMEAATRTDEEERLARLYPDGCRYHCPTRAPGVPWVCTRGEDTEDRMRAEAEAVHAPSVQPSDDRTTPAEIKTSKMQSGLKPPKSPERPPLGECADGAPLPETCPPGQPPAELDDASRSPARASPTCPPGQPPPAELDDTSRSPARASPTCPPGQPPPVELDASRSPARASPTCPPGQPPPARLPARSLADLIADLAAVQADDRVRTWGLTLRKPRD